MGNRASRANRAKHYGVAFQFVLVGVLTPPLKIPKLPRWSVHVEFSIRRGGLSAPGDAAQSERQSLQDMCTSTRVGGGEDWAMSAPNSSRLPTAVTDGN